MAYLFFNDAFFYLPISLFMYAIVNTVVKRVIARKVVVSGYRHTAAIASIALLSSATALGLATFYGDSNLLPQSAEPNQLLIGGLPFIYSILLAYVVRAVPIVDVPPPLVEPEASIFQAVKSPSTTDLKTLAACLGVALVIALSYIYFNRGPNNYDECIIRNTQAAQTQAAVSVIRVSCRNMFPASNRFKEFVNPFLDANQPTNN